MTLTALIVDDESPARKRLRDLLVEMPDVEIVGECSDGAAAVAAIREKAPDVVFLDIQMPGMDGFEVLREVGPALESQVVFVTAYDAHAIEAFEARALDYLLKPFTRERFAESVSRVRERGRSQPDLLARLEELLEAPRSSVERIPVRTGSRVRFLPTADVQWIEADGNYVRLHTAGESHRVRGTLSGITDRLRTQGFVRIHHSRTVNLNHIREVQPWSHGEYVVITRAGTELVSSRSYSDELRRHLSL